MKSQQPLLDVESLRLSLKHGCSSITILDGVSFKIYPGEIVGLVGESGCGKSMTASAIFGLLPSSHQVTGKMIFEKQDLLDCRNEHPRGQRLSIILQDPSLALNPLLSIGRQLIEGLMYHQKMPYQEAWKKGIIWLEKVGIRNPGERMHQYPHQLSGGMKQRILIAMALMCSPSLLIADEPTTALDVTVQLQILELLSQLQKQEKMSMLLITHDLGVVAHSCQRVLVMYAGQIVEAGPVEKIFAEPKHPYTQGLLKSRQSLENSRNKPLYQLEGHPPLKNALLSGCPFASRCSHAMNICLERKPPMEERTMESIRCWKLASKESA